MSFVLELQGLNTAPAQELSPSTGSPWLCQSNASWWFCVAPAE
jgi:hypothetical protein